MTRFTFGLAVMSLAVVAVAQDPGQRQYYGPWIKHSTKNYYYRNLSFNASCCQAAFSSGSCFAFLISSALATRIFGAPGGFSFFLCGQACAFLLPLRS